MTGSEQGDASGCGADQRPLLMIEQTGLAYGYPGLVRLDQPRLEAGLRAACLPITDLDGLLAGRSGTVTVARPDRFLHPTIRTPAAPIG